MDFVNIKTTIAGGIAGLAQIVKLFGLEIPPQILDGITGMATIVAFYFAKDKDKGIK